MASQHQHMKTGANLHRKPKRARKMTAKKSMRRSARRASVKKRR